MSYLMFFFLNLLMNFFKSSSSVDPVGAENRCLTSGVWYYPPVAGSGGFMLSNPPFSSRGDNV